MKWIKGRDGLPSLFKKVQWRNADGGNIPLGEATPLEHYKKTGANIEWHEWLDSSHPEQGEQMAQDIMNILREHSTFVDGQIKALIVHGAIEKIVEYINGKLSSPPPEGQDGLWEEILSQLHPYFLKEDYQDFKEQFKQQYQLIKK